jgi:hypothetical protein
MVYEPQKKLGYPRSMGDDYFTLLETAVADEQVLSEATATAFYLPSSQVTFYFEVASGTTVTAAATMTFRLYNKTLPTTTTYGAYGSGTLFTISSGGAFPQSLAVYTPGSGWYKLVITSAANKMQLAATGTPTLNIYYKAI